MTNITDIMPLVDKDMYPTKSCLSEVQNPQMYYTPDVISSIGCEIEKLRLDLIVGLIRKRKTIRDVTIHKIDDLIRYCDDKIHEIGNEASIKADKTANSPAHMWQKKIIDLEILKIGEHKELFRDCLFLRNEWIKSLMNYVEEKKLDEMLNDY